MKIASWNVNSIKARQDHVVKFLETRQPDVLMIQELKGLEFDDAPFRTLGYESVAEGQKAYNGVAVLARHPIEVIQNILPGNETDAQARYLEVEIQGVRLVNIYLPNGNPWPSEKYDYKLDWMKRLKARLQSLVDENIAFAVGGDFNVIPEDKDCYNPKSWEHDALFRIETRRAFRKILNLGLTDAFRVFFDDAGHYTFWDYQAGAWHNNKGIRIDHFLLSPEIADRLLACAIDTEPRSWDKPSDHTPILIEIST